MRFDVLDVHDVLDTLEIAGVDAVVLGGWGVDALLGEQTRPHDDLDLWVEVEHDRLLREALGELGFAEEADGVWHNYVLRDQRGREVDIHLVSYRPDGAAVYQGHSGGDFVMPPTAFALGSIGGRAVRCVSGDQQMLDHSDGYDPSDTDDADMRVLHERLGVSYLPPFPRSAPS